MAIWQSHQDELEELRGEKVLPAAVVATAVYLAGDLKQF